MDKHERTLKTYKMNHSGGAFDDEERSKIKRGGSAADKLAHGAERLYRDASALDDDALDALENAEYAAKKARGSMKTHKSRLTELEKNEEFN